MFPMTIFLEVYNTIRPFRQTKWKTFLAVADAFGKQIGTAETAQFVRAGEITKTATPQAQPVKEATTDHLCSWYRYPGNTTTEGTALGKIRDRQLLRCTSGTNKQPVSKVQKTAFTNDQFSKKKPVRIWISRCLLWICYVLTRQLL